MINVNHFRKVVVIIGNGFDLDLKLKTSYRDFMISDTFKEYRDNSHSQPNDHYSRLNLFDYLQGKFDGNDKRWIDIEIELREFAQNIDLKDYDSQEIAIGYIMTSFNQIRNALTEYLTTIDYSSINIQSTAIEALKALRGGRNCMVYNFNYTDISRLYGYIGGIPLFSVYNIHGTLKEKSIVLGFDKTLLPYTELDFMIKYQSDSYQTSTDNDIRKDLYEAEEVLVFGHTLGSTDHSYFQEFLQKQIGLTRDKRTQITIVTLNAKTRREINREIDEMTDNESEMLNINYIHTHGNTSQEEIHSFFVNLSKRISPNISGSVIARIKPPTIIPF